MRYYLNANEGQVKLRILYWNAGSYAVSADGFVQDATPWDRSLGTPAELTGTKGCGENRFVGGASNYLEFILTAGCEIKVTPIDSFAANVRMAWTLDEFYSTGGPTTFTDNVAGALGIHSSQIKVVSVYEGSVVVDFTLEEYDDEETEEDAAEFDASIDEADVVVEAKAPVLTAEEKLAINEAKLQEMIAQQDSAFGAPVLSASTSTTDGEAKTLKLDPSW